MVIYVQLKQTGELNRYFLTIAASDSSGGAGIQQDIKVAGELGYRTLCAVTGITVQDYNHLFYVEPVRSSILSMQADKCLSSFPVSAVKIGALCSASNVPVVAQCLQKHSSRYVVLDPVLASTGGSALFPGEAVHALTNILFPLTGVVTPNKHEFEMLAGVEIDTIEQGAVIAETFCRKWNTSILLKGGHFGHQKIREALITADGTLFFERNRLKLSYDHGTGCTFSTALACFLGNGLSLPEAYHKASEYLVRHFRE